MHGLRDELKNARAPALIFWPWQQRPQDQPDDDEAQDGEACIGVCGKCLLARAVSIDGAQAEIQPKDHCPGRGPVGDDRGDVRSSQLLGHRYQWMWGSIAKPIL